MNINPYLTFNGNCAEAFRVYEQVLGGKIVMIQTHGDSPMKDQVPDNWREKILHVRLEVDGAALMGSDAPDKRYERPQGLQVSISLKSAADGERIFTALAEQGQVAMPFQPTFWSPGFGMLTDRFGIPWMVNCEPAQG